VRSASDSRFASLRSPCSRAGFQALPRGGAESDFSAHIVVLLTALTKKDTHFNFKKEYKEAFKELKYRIVTALILVIFNPKKEVMLKTDASE
jgi:hypothetical protein